MKASTEASVSRAVLMGCNVVLMVSGVALGVLGAGLLLDVPRVLLSRLIASAPAHPPFYYLALALLALGLLVAALAVLGCWAARLRSACLLALYMFALLVLVSAECVAVAVALLCPPALGLRIGAAQLTDLLQRNYGVPGQEQLTAAFDLAQAKFACCGIAGAADYELSWWRLKELGQPELRVPRSCCTLRNAADARAFLDPQPANLTLCQEGVASARHAPPCRPRLEAWLRDHGAALLAATLGLALAQLAALLGALLACLRVQPAAT